VIYAKKGKRAILCYSCFVVLLGDFENCLPELLHCICGKGNGMGTVSCIFRALTINIISLSIYRGDKITELKGRSWVIRRSFFVTQLLVMKNIYKYFPYSTASI